MTDERTRLSHAFRNTGIQANSVIADALAVGERAHAEKTVTADGSAQAELTAVISELLSVLNGVDLHGDLRAKIERDVASLRPSMDRGRSAGILEHLRLRLEKIGTSAERVVFSELIKKLAGILFET